MLHEQRTAGIVHDQTVSVLHACNIDIQLQIVTNKIEILLFGQIHKWNSENELCIANISAHTRTIRTDVVLDSTVRHTVQRNGHTTDDLPQWLPAG